MDRPLPARYKCRPIKRRTSVRFSDAVVIIPHPDDTNLQEVRSSARMVIIPHPDDPKQAKVQVHISELLHPGAAEDARFHKHWRADDSSTSADQIVILLVLLCSLPICFTTGVAAWAINNPHDLCKKAPLLAIFFNRLTPALATVLPGLAIGLLLVWFPRQSESTEYHFQRGWNKARLVLTMILVALITAFAMPWTWEMKGWDYRVECSAYSW